MAAPIDQLRGLRVIEIMQDLLSSDSSDDDDDIIDVQLLRNNARRRRWGEVPKVENFIRDVVDKYSEPEFKSDFRVSRETCNYLIELFEQSVYCPRGAPFGGVEAKSAEEHILCYLWFAGNKAVYRTVAHIFGISISTAHKMIDSVINFLTDELGPSVIKFPSTEEDKQQNAKEFEQIAGFTGVVGCIDGTFINIRRPIHKIKSTYVNRHDITSLTLQAICDAKQKFLDVFTGVPGKIHDARTFSLLFIRPKVLQMGRDFHILGDAAYPINENVMTPYREYRDLTKEQREFNYRFCRTRVKIENAFGLLKQRWRQLIRTDMWRVLKTSKFIISCCVMHNLCIERNDFLNELENNARNAQENFVNHDDNARLGQLKRDELARLCIKIDSISTTKFNTK